VTLFTEYPTPLLPPEPERSADRQPAHRAHNPKARHRTLDLMRWGLIPHWAKDIKIGFSTINAMAETVDSKPVFRKAFQRRRCLVPIKAFYEWKKLGPKEKQPYAIALADRGLMPLAGLWEIWRSPAQETVRSFTIITTTPNELCAEVHNRMPVILPTEAWSEWLAEEPAEEAMLKRMLAPYPAERMTMWPVDKRVGNVKNNDPSLMSRLWLPETSLKPP